MKKVLVSLLLVVSLLLGIFSMASCTKPMPDFEMPEGGFNVDNKVEITFWHTMGAGLQTQLESAIKRFNKLYPNITIVHKQRGGYDDVRNDVSKALMAQNQPNLAYCYPDHIALYNTSGGVVTLDQFFEYDQEITRADGSKEIFGLTDEQIEDFVESYLEEGRVFGDGKTYSLPLSKSTELLYYNADFFEKHDLEVPTTWEEMEAVCKRIKEIDPNSIPLGYDSEANWFITLCAQYGYPYTSLEEGNHFQFANEDNYKFVKMIRDWYKKGYVTTQEIYGAYTSTLFTVTAKDEIKSYMSIGSSGGASHQAPTADGDGKFPFTVGIATIPQVDPENPKAISQGPSLCILQDEDPQKVLASWLFVKFLTTDVGFQADFSKASGYVPVIKSAKNDPFYTRFLNGANGTTGITALSAKVCLDQPETTFFTSPAFNGSTVAREQVGIMIKRVLVANWADDKVMSEIDKLFKEAVAICEARS